MKRPLSEVRYGSFRRSFGLPEHLTADAVTASYDAGVLSVRVAGAYAVPAEAQPRRIAIATGAGAPAVETSPEARDAATEQTAEQTA